ncbi:N-acetylmuramoyl-L-alanine amidase family protein [Kaarinaea lacus]
MFKRSKNRDILDGIYQENLWVAGKGKARNNTEQFATDDVGKRKLHPLALLGATSVVLLIGVFTYWLGSSSNVPTGSGASATRQQASSPSSAKLEQAGSQLEAELVSIDGQKSADSGIYSTSLPKTLQKKSHEVDKLEDLAIAKLENVDVDPANYQALAESGVPLAQLFGLSVRTIVIDPGHGGKDPGAVGKLGIYEKDIALEIAKSLRDRLDEHGTYEVLLTRESDETISLNDRVEFANAHNVDLFISIHINYSPRQQSFIETFYFGPTNDSKVADLAKLENADSHYEYGEFKDIIQKIGDTLKFQESRQLAHSVQSNLYGRIKKINKHASDHGIKSAPFVVLLGLDAPSILTEVSCFCNPAEEKRLKTAKYRDNIARYLEQGIVSYLKKNTSVGGKRNGEKEKLAKAQQ